MVVDIGRLPGNIECPFCNGRFKRSGFAKASKPARIKCEGCGRYFHIWETRVFDYTGKNVTESLRIRKIFAIKKAKYDRMKTVVA